MGGEYQYVVVLITAANIKEGQQIADALVKERLAPCVNLVEKISSTFWWENALQHEGEVLLIVKTRAELFERVAKRVKELHSYDVPEVIALPIVKASKKYLDWMAGYFK